MEGVHERDIGSSTSLATQEEVHVGEDHDRPILSLSPPSQVGKLNGYISLGTPTIYELSNNFVTTITL